MKKSILVLTVLMAVVNLLGAKENKKADTYKTYEVVSTLRQSSGTAGSTTVKDNVPVVYFIRDITPEALVKVYNVTQITVETEATILII